MRTETIRFGSGQPGCMQRGTRKAACCVHALLLLLLLLPACQTRDAPHRRRTIRSKRTHRTANTHAPRTAHKARLRARLRGRRASPLKYSRVRTPPLTHARALCLSALRRLNLAATLVSAQTFRRPTASLDSTTVPFRPSHPLRVAHRCHRYGCRHSIAGLGLLTRSLHARQTDKRQVRLTWIASTGQTFSHALAGTARRIRRANKVDRL